MTVAAWLVAGVVAKGGHVKDEHVVVVLAMVGQCLLNQSRCCRCMAHHHALAIADVVDGIFGLGYFPFVVFFPVHCIIVFCFVIHIRRCSRSSVRGKKGVCCQPVHRARQEPFDAKALPNHQGRSPGLSSRDRSLLGGSAPNDMFSVRQRRNYSCATAHGLHVIPSWQPRCRADPGDV